MSESTQLAKKIAYLDCPTGIAGDMCLGALVDAGVPLDYLTEQLNRLGLTGEFELWAENVLRQGQAATRVKVDLTAPSAHSRHLGDIEQLISKAQLSPKATEWSLAIFRRLAEAEGAVHGIAPEAVHFHEVGAVDAIVDIVGTCLGLDWLQVDRLSCSALPTGGGLVRAAHGWLPVPAPAVLKLLQMGQVPIYSNGLQKELVTPTGAAIATTLADHFGPPPAMTLQQVGLGAGGHDLPIPNLLRLWIGQAPDGLITLSSKAHTHSHPPIHPSTPPHLEPVTVLETQVDDLSPQAIGYLYERLWNVGALDVFTQAVGMKKSRPGVLLTVICQPNQTSACEQVLFEETTTLGIRRQLQWRHALTRTLTPIDTPYGPVQLKLAYHPETRQLMNVHPEFEDCAQLARQHQVPWQEVHRSALSQWYGQHPPQLKKAPSPQSTAPV
ncbi:nickel pincer cofactor biosynthesis protein LarC [Pseudanabaena sp. FACHB-2040]|uniref:nickel pincer cofactor biosynthesis protein LarC n=1 Tax=Pseudanabaena sp. FACHB-2040 TaxID=2692859 RepID=UPI001683DF4C|nr:nickel pincer cofactor biosynthesis protein LarC [Pseudanabaena sp. FACHB-2040]MBD2258507.1 nickel pincer cofactor biosynthesis protein LarC [Pseudanabaena sp. FACHB-2040]